MSASRWISALTGATALLALAVPAGAAPGTPGPGNGRRVASHVPDSAYGDPCEGGGPDLRRVSLADLFEDDRDRVVAGTVRLTATLCAPVADATLDAIRVDLHPRLDGPDGPDYAESPSRHVVVLRDGSQWRWHLREGSATVASGSAAAVGAGGQRTGLVADLPACEVAAASGATCDAERRLPDRPPGPLPPLSLRACTADVDCGPSYRTIGGVTGDDPAPQLTGVDYVPEPRFFPVTYPSLCQVGGVARTPQRTSPTEVLADPGAIAPLLTAGFTELARLADGRARLRGSLAVAEGLVGPDAVDAVVLRRADASPDDPLFATTGPAAPTGQWSMRRVGLAEARDHGRGAGTRVAILDTGFDGRHPDLAGRAVAARDFVATRDGGTGGELSRTGDSDLDGHGSFVASLVAAVTDNGVGMASLAPDTRLLVARVFDAEGCASDGAVVEAMAWATDSGADVINLSLGGSGASELLAIAGAESALAGAVPVAAAGNSGTTRIEFPAAYPAYLSVAATGYADGPGEDPVASYSTRNDEVDLAAPGGSNVGTAPERDILGACWGGPTSGHGYCRQSGTSFATPLVAATIAVARSIDPGRTTTGVRELLADTAIDVTLAPGTSVGRDDRTGDGRVDAGALARLLAAREDTLDELPDSATATAASVAASRRAFGNVGAAHVVLARNDVFADALAGAPLAGDRGPILLTSPGRLDPAVRDELRRVLRTGGRVWMLGGESALTQRVVDEVRAAGYAPARLHGPTRVDTAVAVARQVGPGPTGEVLVASAANWPDAISGGVYAADRGVPLLLTWPDSAAASRSPGVLEAVEDLAASVVVLGGDAAVSGTVFAQLRQLRPTTRVSGPSRFATAVAVARTLWGRSGFAPGQEVVVINGDRADGWAMGLAAAPLAARTDAPLLLVNDDLTTSEPAGYLRDQLAYRLDRPAHGLVVGPITASPSGATRAFTTQRLRELLGG